MSNNFEIVARFLDRYGDEVEGRELDEVPADLKPKLKAFARGGLPEGERQDVARLLKENPRWVALLAEEARTARSEGGDKA